MRARKQLVELLVHEARKSQIGSNWSKIAFGVELAGGRITQGELEQAVREADNSKLSQPS